VKKKTLYSSVKKAGVPRGRPAASEPRSATQRETSCVHMVASHDTVIIEKYLDASIIWRLAKIYIYILIAVIF
jgi:hypothetical protein